MRQRAASLLVVVALADEERAVRPAVRRFDSMLLMTGMGRERARARTAAFLEERRSQGGPMPGLILATGFAGALRDGWRPGTIVIASSVVDGGDPARRWEAPRGALEAALAAAGPACEARAGAIATVDRVLRGSAQKRHEASALGVDAVDMESVGVLEAAVAHGVDVLCARAILDEVDLEVPLDLGRLVTSDGRPRLFALLGQVVRRPRAIRSLLQLGARAKAARRALAVFLPRFLEGLP